jgi:hypothetical protein
MAEPDDEVICTMPNPSSAIFDAVERDPEIKRLKALQEAGKIDQNAYLEAYIDRMVKVTNEPSTLLPWLPSPPSPVP